MIELSLRIKESPFSAIILLALWGTVCVGYGENGAFIHVQYRIETWAALGGVWFTSTIDCIVQSTPTLQDDLVMTGSCPGECSVL